jgi:hypothetical protein
VLFEVVRDVSTDDSPEDEPLFDPRITNYNWLAGVLGGVWTFVVGYLAMGVVALAPDGPAEGADPSDVLAEIGRIFYNAHNVALDVQAIKDNVVFLDGGVTINSSRIEPNETVIVDTDSTQPLTIIGENADQVVPLNLGRVQQPIQHAQDKPELLYYAVPVVVLIAAGAGIAYFTLADTASIHESVMPALGLSIGYTAAAILGTFFVGLELAEGAILVTPSLGQTLVFGLVYSLLGGLIGGYAAAFWKDRGVSIRRRFGR